MRGEESWGIHISMWVWLQPYGVRLKPDPQEQFIVFAELLLFLLPTALLQPYGVRLKPDLQEQFIVFAELHLFLLPTAHSPDFQGYAI